MKLTGSAIAAVATMGIMATMVATATITTAIIITITIRTIGIMVIVVALLCRSDSVSSGGNCGY